MTAEEAKARELIERMKGGCCRCPHDSKDAAEECIDEIITALSGKEILIDSEWPRVINPNEEQIEYWTKVKQHLINL